MSLPFMLPGPTFFSKFYVSLVDIIVYIFNLFKKVCSIFLFFNKNYVLNDPVNTMKIGCEHNH